MELFKVSTRAWARGHCCWRWGAAHLPGMVAAYTELPVIGVPILTTHLNGEDSLLSIVQMPKGVPVATVAINGAYNAGLLAAQIVATADESLRDRIAVYKKELASQVVEKAKDVERVSS